MARGLKKGIEIPAELVEQDGGIVVLSVKEYEKLLARAVPTFYLKGNAATKLDRLVESGLQEHRKGKTRAVRSLADLDARS